MAINQRLRDDFNARKGATEQSTALVVVRDKEIEDWKAANNLQLTSRKSAVGQRDSASFAAGYKAGSNLQMRKGVSTSNAPRLR